MLFGTIPILDDSISSFDGYCKSQLLLVESLCFFLKSPCLSVKSSPLMFKILGFLPLSPCFGSFLELTHRIFGVFRPLHSARHGYALHGLHPGRHDGANGPHGHAGPHQRCGHQCCGRDTEKVPGGQSQESETWIIHTLWCPIVSQVGL